MSKREKSDDVPVGLVKKEVKTDARDLEQNGTAENDVDDVAASKHAEQVKTDDVPDKNENRVSEEVTASLKLVHNDEVLTPNTERPVKTMDRGILKRAESTDEGNRNRRSSMKPSESLDGSKHEGILKKKRSCLVKTVSFSATVSEKSIPALPPSGEPKDEGDYVERDVPNEVPRLEKKNSYVAALEAQRMNDRKNSLDHYVDKQREKTKRKEDPLRRRYRPTIEDLPDDEDVDEYKMAGVYKCGYLLVGFAPVKKKKTMFVTLTERCLEFHENLKAYRNGKMAKHLVDLSISFNVHGEHFDPKMRKCFCLMGPDETICMRVESGVQTDEGWRRALVKAVHEARQNKMDRTPRPEDIFDAAYDVQVCLYMKHLEKYNADRKESGYTNICNVHKELLGKKRLVLYPNTLAIVDLFIEPTPYGLPPAGYPPFRAANMFIIDRSTIAYYGCSETFFYIRIGKGSPFKGFEVLCQLETTESCLQITNRLQKIIERDLEARRRNPPRTSNYEHEMHGMESLSVPSPLLHRTKLSLDSPVLTARDRRLMLGRECLSFASLEKDDSAPSSPFGNYNRPRGSLGNFQIDHLSSRFDVPRGSIHSLGNLPIDRPRLATGSSTRWVQDGPGSREVVHEGANWNMVPTQSSQKNEGGYERKMSDANMRRRVSRPDSQDKPDFSEPVKPALPPLKFNTNKPSGEMLLQLQREKEISAETVRNGFDPETQNPDGSRKEPKKSFMETMRSRAVPTAPPPQPAPPAVYSPSKKGNIFDDDYILMGPGEWAKPVEYVSEKAAGCSSPEKKSCSHMVPGKVHLGCQAHSRTHSFGAQYLRSMSPNRIPPTVQLPNSERKISAVTANEGSSDKLELPDEDSRKRAFSLGSRNFFNGSFLGLQDIRKFVNKHRTSSPHITTASKASLNSSAASPTSGSVNLLTSTDNLDGRSASFGSGRSSPGKIQPSFSKSKIKSDDDLVAIDFSQTGMKKYSFAEKKMPFGGGGAAGRKDFQTLKLEEEERERKQRERAAYELKRKEEEEARQLEEKEREKERKAREKRERKEEKEREKDKDFRPKADSGIADCTPSSSFSGKKDSKKQEGDYVYSDVEGLKCLADIKKRKKEEIEQKNLASASWSVLAHEDSKISSTAMQTIGTAMAVADLSRKSSLCAELIRKSSICAAIKEETEGDTDSRGEPADKKAAPAPVSRKSSSSNMSPFRRFFSFRKN